MQRIKTGQVEGGELMQGAFWEVPVYFYEAPLYIWAKVKIKNEIKSEVLDDVRDAGFRLFRIRPGRNVCHLEFYKSRNDIS